MQLSLYHEYAETKDVNRARSSFYTGAARVMLYTERAHFYRRQKIRGIRDLYFYSLPDRERCGTYKSKLTAEL